MSKKQTGLNPTTIADDVLVDKIYQFRRQKVMLDSDLAELYGVETKRLNERVSRNRNRFPSDFMFQLTEDEWESLRSQIATSKEGRGGRTYLPNVFTEHGVLMLSSILNSEQAIQVNIQIMRIFSKIRQFIIDNAEVKLEIAEIKYAVEQISKKQRGHDQNIELLFEYIERLQEKEERTVTRTNSKGEIGFKVGEK